MFSLCETKNGVWKRTIAYGGITDIYEAREEALNSENIPADNLSVFYELAGAILKARAIVSSVSDTAIYSKNICVLLETSSGKYYGLFKTTRTKTFNTLDALRNYLFDTGYEYTIVIF